MSPGRLVVRAATEQDASLLLSWRNDAETRRWSRTSAAVEPDQHADWLRGVLDDSRRWLWIAEVDAEPVATVRHDVDSAGRAEVSLAVAPAYRGRGVATAAIRAADARLLTSTTVEVVDAHVHPDHAASLRVFERAGYVRVDLAADGLVVLRRTREASA